MMWILITTIIIKYINLKMQEWRCSASTIKTNELQKETYNGVALTEHKKLISCRLSELWKYSDLKQFTIWQCKYISSTPSASSSLTHRLMAYCLIMQWNVNNLRLKSTRNTLFPMNDRQANAEMLAELVF